MFKKKYIDVIIPYVLITNGLNIYFKYFIKITVITNQFNLEHP